MANKKNSRNMYKNTHKHVYQKKKNPKKNPRNPKKKQSFDRVDQKMDSLEGSRVINLKRLQQYSKDLSQHSSSCDGPVVLDQEKRAGMASVLKGDCTSCGKAVTLETSSKVKGPKGYCRWEANLAAVWGQMATGAGHSQLEETMSVMGVPVMTKASFIATERDIGGCWRQALLSSMANAGQEERRIAIEKGNFHEDVPAITVIVDGGWSKRSHKHSYNAKSGVAIIIGKETGKLLYLGVRNKYCHACATGIPEENHDCFRNWTASSSEMETDIIVDGFLEAERVHGVRYTKFVGDGDSSIYPALISGVPGWGHAIKKLECANHACKCYRGALERLVQDNASYKGSGKLTKKMRQKLVSAARCAIKMRSKESDAKNAVVQLKKDLMNGPMHCFGIHSHCSADFCTVAQAHKESSPSTGAGSIVTGGESVAADISTDGSDEDVPEGTWSWLNIIVLLIFLLNYFCIVQAFIYPHIECFC